MTAILVGMTTGMPPDQEWLLDGRYLVGARLGVGGVAEVFQAFDERLQRDVAVKIFRGDVADELSRHEEEMRTLARLDHASLVTVFDAGVDDASQRPYLVMALVEGSTLGDQLAGGRLSEAYVAGIGASLAGALAYVHGQGVVHRDIKPANVLISVDGRVHLADFGIARLADSAHLTRAGDVLGTPAYFAPEQVSGEPVGPPADVYALGLVLLECLTGRREYVGTPMEAAMARLNRPPAIPADLPLPWRDLLTAMTAQHPSTRISAAQAEDRLRAIASGDPRTAGMAGLPQTQSVAATTMLPMATTVMPPVTTATAPPAAPPARRRGSRLAIALIVVVLIAVGATVIVVGLNRNNNSPSGHCASAGTNSSQPLKGRLEADMEKLESLVCR